MYGYKIVNHTLTIDETKAEIAAEIFRRYAAGDRFCDILAWLHNAGIRNAAGNEWSSCNLSMMLRKRLYIGEYRRSGIDGVNMVPAIVSKEVFEVVQNRLDESAKRKREGRS
ncbi:MAG: recombinase family protein, partial [Clostridia bacterium]|nr:recombinase family protein [Clostridia bacterium]